MVGVQADTSGLMSATAQTLRRMAQLTGFDHRTVLMGYAGVVLKTWAGRTKVATQASIDRKSRLHAVKSLGYTGSGDNHKSRGGVTVNSGFKRGAPLGRVWIKVRDGGGRNNWLLAMGDNFAAPGNAVRSTGSIRRGKGSRIVNGVFNKFRQNPSATTSQWIANIDEAVAAVQGKMPQSIMKGRRSIGLSRQSVLQIADALGIDLLRVQGGGTLSAAGIAKARAALATTGKGYRNGFGARSGGQVQAYVDLINRFPYGGKIGMDRTLRGVLAGQNKYFERSYAKGAFDTQKRAVRAFPNLFKYRELQNLSLS